ncbi:conserved oligomeric golgi complex subunit 4 [Anaeramoeba ignava]|uniref:Conserved oligomeric Golgi complex subunit 4 n=1 Tax=Anaeramoeba ignava TaxID=1746090 RepID=A0A9Q0L9X2_ANAIG|nr:conserved oligomeric golgi complex subunit 4 [Anaeramoeba ignava]
MDSSEIFNKLFQLQEIEKNIDKEIKISINNNKKQNNIKIQEVQNFEFKINQIQKTSETIIETLSNTCSVAENIFSQIRMIDLAQDRLQQVRKKTQDIVDLKSCTIGMEDSIQANNYESAAKYYQRFLEIDQSIVEESVRNSFVKNGENLRVKIIGNLEEIIEKSNDLPSNQVEKKIKMVIEGVKFFPQIGLYKEGISRLSNYIRACIGVFSNSQYIKILKTFQKYVENNSNKDLPTLYNPKNQSNQDDQENIQETIKNQNSQNIQDIFNTNHISSTIELFEYSASIIARFTQNIDSLFGAGASLETIRHIQAQTHIQAIKIVDNYLQFRKLQSTIDFMKEHKFSKPANELNILLNEISVILKHSEMFESFLKKHAKQKYKLAAENQDVWKWLDSLIKKDVNFQQPFFSHLNENENENENDENKNENKNNNNLIDGLPQNNEMENLTQKLIDYYIRLEESFMVDSLQKAFDAEEVCTNGLMTTLVDDVFFVIKKCITRAITTTNPFCACAILNHSNTYLNIVVNFIVERKQIETSKSRNDFIRFLDENTRFSNVNPRSFSSFDHISFPANSQNTSAKISRKNPQIFPTEISSGNSSPNISDSNTKSISNYHLLNNLDGIINYTNKLYEEILPICQKLFSENFYKMVSSCMTSLHESAQDFLKLLQQGLKRIFVSTQQRLKSAIDVLSSSNYNLTESEYSQLESSQPMVSKTIQILTDLINPLQKSLTEKNLEIVLQFMIEFIATYLQNLILKKQFSHLGALVFDKEIRIISSFLSDKLKRPVRDQFVRLFQISSILNLDHVNEISNYWDDQSGRVVWRLSPNEIRQFLNLRIDFDKKEILKLKL